MSPFLTDYVPGFLKLRNRIRTSLHKLCIEISSFQESSRLDEVLEIETKTFVASLLKNYIENVEKRIIAIDTGLSRNQFDIRSA